MSEIKFSEMITRLEEIVALLEKGDCELEESMKLFDEGTSLAKICNEKLIDAKLKINNLNDVISEDKQ